MEGDEKTFSSLDLPFTTTSAASHDVPLSTRHTRITMANRHEYVRLALNYRSGISHFHYIIYRFNREKGLVITELSKYI